MIEAVFNPLPISDRAVCQAMMATHFVDDIPPETYTLEIAHPVLGPIKLNFQLGSVVAKAYYWFTTMEGQDGKDLS